MWAIAGKFGTYLASSDLRKCFLIWNFNRDMELFCFMGISYVTILAEEKESRVNVWSYICFVYKLRTQV